MAGYQPPYTITATILNQVVAIVELVGRWSALAEQSSPLLRKENRIRTIQASLAIEHNSLSTEQVSAIMDGKRVLAPLKDIQEVRNAILAYDKLPDWQSYRADDLLAAHHLLMLGLLDAPGQLRDSNAGIYRDKQLIHMAPPANQLPRLINELLLWLQHTDIHPLVASSIFHYELEFIHPFTDGNGRMGRLWQTLILSEWRSELAWLPVETLIHNQQSAYYQVLGECDRASDCTAFITFMLEKLLDALNEGIVSHQQYSNSMSVEMSVEMSAEMSVENRQPLSQIAERILLLIKANATVTMVQIAAELNVSKRTIERHITLLQRQQRLTRIGPTKKGYWQLI